MTSLERFGTLSLPRHNGIRNVETRIERRDKKHYSRFQPRSASRADAEGVRTRDEELATIYFIP